MKQFAKCVVLSGAVLMMSLPALAQTLDPEGLWLTENKRSVVELKKQSDGTLGGKIAWIIEGGMQFDEKNPDEAQRSTPMCGLTIVSNLKQGANDPNSWHNGKIYKADDGDMYDARLTMETPDQLEVRGFMGVSFLGKSQTWTRVSAKDYPRCKPAKR
jgi:uncharacterized protein (DUF2147 family)